MAETPEAMMTKGRPEVPHFPEDEKLYRRFHPEHLEGSSIAIEALELPDMSVNRQSLGPPEWLLIDEQFEDWGVLAFEVRHIPTPFLHLGVTTFAFSPKHRPLKYNYPHTEVWAFRDDQHVDAKNAFLLDPDAHQRWRQLLIWKCRPVIMPTKA